jgi:hypothetical protein
MISSLREGIGAASLCQAPSRLLPTRARCTHARAPGIGVANRAWGRVTDRRYAGRAAQGMRIRGGSGPLGQGRGRSDTHRGADEVVASRQSAGRRERVAGCHCAQKRSSATTVSQDTPRLLDALAVLAKHRVRFLLIGGYAAIARGSPLLTGDIDICYSRDGENLERLAGALRELRATLRGAPPDEPFQLDAKALKEGDHFTFSTTAGPLACLGTPAGTRGFDDLNQAATDIDLDGLTVRVPAVDDLIRMKRAAGRLKDQAGLEWLRALREEMEERGPD